MVTTDFAGFTISPGEIGYAVGKETEEGRKELIKCGVVSFSDGAVHDKAGEHSACADRRMRRQTRRGYARKRLRKIETLRVLSSLGFCPEVPEEKLKEWRYGKLYPDVPELKEWLATDFENNVNPYHDRFLCATSILDMSKKENRYCFGRAMYHLCQRRGYLSNAKDEKSNNMAGEVNKGIAALTKAIEDSGCPTMGAYFYRQLQKGERIRGCYTGREVHYAAEFNYICDKQNISDDVRTKLRHAIFFHRPLKSQKGNVGRCVFEPSKFRCQRSHPLFEEYRMWQFINNIRIRPRGTEEFQPLTDEQVEKIGHLFCRSKAYFDFIDIAKAIAGKNATVNYKGNRSECDYEFNFPMDKSVAGNQTIYQIIALLGKDSGADWKNWKEILAQRYRLAKGKSIEDIVTDVWHVMMFFDDTEMIRDWFRANLGVTDEKDLNRVASYAPEDDYASVSLCAVKKILPFMEQRYRFDEAVFFANLRSVLPKGSTDKLYEAACNGISSILNDYNREQQKNSKESVVTGFLRDLCPDAKVDKLYHPSAVANFIPASVYADGMVVLGDVDFTLKNPVAHRAEVQFRKLANELSKSGLINKNTRIRVMVSTEMHGMNERRGIAQWNKERETARKEAIEGITQFFAEAGERVNVTEDQITKWLLWKEQKEVCLYTGKQISVSDFLGPNAKFDIEHTVPLSRGGDDSLMNKTLCDSLFNRETKKMRLPSELGKECYDEVMARVAGLGWETELEKVKSEYKVAKDRAKKSIEGKSGLLAKAARIQFRLDYLQGKIDRFRMTDVPDGFAFKQDAVGKTVRNHVVSFLKTGYRYVFSESQETVNAYRKIWGLPSKYEYDRDFHRKNCIDAIVLTFLGQSMHNEWKHYWETYDNYTWSRRPVFPKPWGSFTNDVMTAQEGLLIHFENRDNFIRSRKHVVRDVRGFIRRGADGKPLYQNSDCVGKSLHKDTYISCRKDENGNFEYGVRKPLVGMTAETAGKIIDPVLREKVLDILNTVGEKGLEDFIYQGHKVRHVRVSVANKYYIPLAKHRDLSKMEHKQNIYVENDINYCLGLYEGGRFEIVSPFAALTRQREGKPMLAPEIDGNKLTARLTAGTLVLFYENDKDELYKASREELARRLYYTKSFATSNGYAVLFFKHVAEGNPDGKCEVYMAGWKNDDPYRPIVKVGAAKCNVLVEGMDFTINRQGDILWR